jgi:hypothetical protein
MDVPWLPRDPQVLSKMVHLHAILSYTVFGPGLLLIHSDFPGKVVPADVVIFNSSIVFLSSAERRASCSIYTTKLICCKIVASKSLFIVSIHQVCTTLTKTSLCVIAHLCNPETPTQKTLFLC